MNFTEHIINEMSLAVAQKVHKARAENCLHCGSPEELCKCEQKLDRSGRLLKSMIARKARQAIKSKGKVDL